MASFGIGIGAFADGFMRGVNMGKTLKGVRKENEADAVRKAAMEEARKARDEQIEAETQRLMGAGIGDQSSVQAAQPIPTGAQPGQPEPRQMQPQEKTEAQAFPVDMSGDTPPSPPMTAPDAAPTPSAAPAPAATVVGESAPRRPEPSSRQGAPVTPPAAAGISGALGMTPQQARKIAEQNVPTVIDIFQKQGVPKIAEMYLEQGDPAKAEAFIQWSEQSQNRKNMGTWARAWRATQLGNIESAADHFFDLYKSMDDSVTLSGKEVVKDKEGNITGFNVKMRDKASGENRAVFVNREQLLNMGLSAMSPPQLFEATWKREEAARKAQTDAQAEVGKIQMQTAKELTVEGARQQGRIELENHKNASQANKVQRDIEAKVGVLQRAGYSEEFIREALPQILGVDSYKRATSPEEARRLAFGDRMKNDMRFSRLSPDEQRKIIDQDMALIYSGMSPTQAPGGATPSQGSAPAAPANPAARGLPVLDTKTGKVIYR